MRQTASDVFRASYILPEGWQDHRAVINGHSIRYAHVPSFKIPPKGTIIILPGYRDPIETYGPLVSSLQWIGYEVFLMDWFGQGKSERADPKRPHLPPARDSEYDVADLAAFEKIVAQKRMSDGPLAVLAHSNAGHTLALRLKENPKAFDGAMFLDPLFGLNRKALSPLFNFATRIAAAVGLGKKPFPLPVDEITMIGQFLAHEDAGPGNAARAHFNAVRAGSPELWIADMPSSDWYNKKKKTLCQTRRGEFFKSITTPALFVAGGRDHLVDVGLIRQAARHAPAGRFLKVPGAGHNAMHDTDSQQSVMGHLLSFLQGLEQARLPRPANDRGQPPCDGPSPRVAVA